MSLAPNRELPGLHLASTGSYPRIGDGPELQILRRATASLDRGERNMADLLDAEHEMTRLAIADQLKAGLEVITDGQIRWYDPISHIASKLANVKIAGLQRYFDTNFYFRQPVLTGAPSGAMRSSRKISVSPAMRSDIFQLRRISPVSFPSSRC